MTLNWGKETSLGHPGIPQSKEVLKNVMGTCHKDITSHSERVPADPIWDNLSTKVLKDKMNYKLWNERSPDISINKKCHSHQQFLASKYEWGLPKLQSSRCCHPPQWLPRSSGNEAARWTRKQDWPQTAEVLMKGMNSVSPEACIFPYTECWIP